MLITKEDRVILTNLYKARQLIKFAWSNREDDNEALQNLRKFTDDDIAVILSGVRGVKPYLAILTDAHFTYALMREAKSLVLRATCTRMVAAMISLRLQKTDVIKGLIANDKELMLKLLPAQIVNNPELQEAFPAIARTIFYLTFKEEIPYSEPTK